MTEVLITGMLGNWSFNALPCTANAEEHELTVTCEATCDLIQALLEIKRSMWFNAQQVTFRVRFDELAKIEPQRQ